MCGLIVQAPTEAEADFEFYSVDAENTLRLGKVTIELEYISKGMPKGSTISNGGTVKLYLNGELRAEGEAKKVMFRHSIEPFEVRRDSVSPINNDCKGKGAFPFNGKIDRIRFETTPPKK